MEYQKYQEKIEGLTKQVRQRVEYVNSLNEVFYFSDCNAKKIRRLFYPVQAGITYPDPDYFCQPLKSDRISSSLYVLEYVVSGKGYIQHGNRIYPVCAGDSYFINRAFGNRWYADPEDPYEKKWVNFCGRFPESLVSAYNMTDAVYVEPVNTEDLLDQIHEILLGYDLQDPHEADLRLMHLLVDAFDRFNAARTTKTPKKQEKVMIGQILEYISDNLLFENLSLSVICASFYISYSTLLRLFERELCTTPARYIVLQRIEYAKQLLLTTENTVDRISEFLHFSSSQHFRKVFSEVCGMPPSKWRKKKLEDAEINAQSN